VFFADGLGPVAIRTTSSSKRFDVVGCIVPTRSRKVSGAHVAPLSTTPEPSRSRKVLAT